MHDARTVVGGDIIAWDYAERIGRFVNYLVAFDSTWLHPWEELLIVYAEQVGTLAAPQNLDWLFVALFVFLWLEVGAQSAFGKYVYSFFTGVWVLSLDGYVVNLRSYAQCGVRWQCPRCGCPCEYVNLHVGLSLEWRNIGHSKLCRDGCVLHVAVASRLVQLVARKSGAGSWRIWLYGVALI